MKQMVYLLVANAVYGLNQTDLRRALHAGNETGLSWTTIFQLSSVVLLGVSYLLIGISTFLIIHLIRAKKEQPGPRVISGPLPPPDICARELPSTSRNGYTSDADLSVRFNCNRKSENVYEELDGWRHSDADATAYNEIEVYDELEAYYDSLCEQDPMFLNNLDSTHAKSVHKTLNRFEA